MTTAARQRVPHSSPLPGSPSLPPRRYLRSFFLPLTIPSRGRRRGNAVGSFAFANRGSRDRGGRIDRREAALIAIEISFTLLGLLYRDVIKERHAKTK